MNNTYKETAYGQKLINTLTYADTQVEKSHYIDIHP